MPHSGVGFSRVSNSTNAVVAGFVALFVAMGIGRFSYTSILPLMQSQAHLSVTEAGWLASSNYLGYLIGAFAAGVLPWGKRRAFHLRLQIVLSIVTTGLMGCFDSVTSWLALRLVSGVSSGLIFVLSSGFVLDALSSERRAKWVGYFYAGVGSGIAVTGLLVPMLGRLTWRGTWLGLFAVAGLLTATVWRRMREPGEERAGVPAASATPPSTHPMLFGWLLTAYGLEGIGYVVSATFLVALVHQLPHLGAFAPYSWVVVGLAAAPSTLLWSWWSARVGVLRAMVVAFVVQTFGVILPVWAPNVVGVTCGSILLGGTFMGISTLATAASRLMRPTQSGLAISQMTAAFGLGQMIGPAGAGWTVSWTHSYSLSLVVAAGCLMAAAVILQLGRLRTMAFGQ